MKNPRRGGNATGVHLERSSRFTSRPFCEARATGGKPASARLVMNHYVDTAFYAMNSVERFAADGGQFADEAFIKGDETMRPADRCR